MDTKNIKNNCTLNHFLCDNIARCLISLYIVFYSFICFLKFKSFSYFDFDLAVHAQVLWNILNGSTYSSILGVSFLGNHAHLINFFIVPIYYIFPNSLTLLILQTVALGFSAWPLYLMARDVLNMKWGVTVIFAYLLYPGLGFTNLYEFHPTVFATLFLSWMLYYFYKKRFFLFFIFMMLGLFCQENIAFAITATGIYAWFCRRSFRWIFWPFALGVGSFYFAVFHIMPYFNQDTIQFIGIYSHFGSSYTEIVKNIILNPLNSLRFMLMQHKLVYLMQVFSPLSFIPLISPQAMVLSLPYFLQHLLSGRYMESVIYYHYMAEMIPLIFFAFILGVRNISRIGWMRFHENSFMICIAAASIACNLSFGPLPEIYLSKSQLLDEQTAKIKYMFLRKIPGQAGIVATFEFLPHLTQRAHLYSFHHVYSGRHTLSSRAYQLPQDASYALLNFNDHLTFRGFYNPGNYNNIVNFLSEGQWGVVDVRGSIVLFERGRGDTSELYEIYTSPPGDVFDKIWCIDGALELAYYKLEEPQNGILQIDLYWHSLRKTSKDIIVFFDIIDRYGIVKSHLIMPICYRIYPTNAWSEGEWIKERKYLPIPSHLEPGGYALMMGFLSFNGHETIPVNNQDILGRVPIGSFFVMPAD
jgi:uncharacterized membrane protein